MKTYLTESQLDPNKTYYKYVDVAVNFSDKDSIFMQKLPANKLEMISIIKSMNPKNEISSYEIIRKSFRLKDKWL